MEKYSLPELLAQEDVKVVWAVAVKPPSKLTVGTRFDIVRLRSSAYILSPKTGTKIVKAEGALFSKEPYKEPEKAEEVKPKLRYETRSHRGYCCGARDIVESTTIDSKEDVRNQYLGHYAGIYAGKNPPPGFVKANEGFYVSGIIPIDDRLNTEPRKEIKEAVDKHLANGVLTAALNRAPYDGTEVCHVHSFYDYAYPGTEKRQFNGAYTAAVDEMNNSNSPAYVILNPRQVLSGLYIALVKEGWVPYGQWINGNYNHWLCMLVKGPGWENNLLASTDEYRK